jgi:hypothetical protein
MRSSVLLTACAAAVLLTSCHDDEVCNPGLELKGGVCVPVAATAAPGATPDAGTDAASSADPDGAGDASPG